MSNEDIKAEIARDALDLCKQRMSVENKARLPGVLNSIRVQLEWLVDFFEGRNSEHAKLHKLVFGHYAIHEVDPTDTEFIDALTKAFYVATQHGKGLRIDLKMLGYDS